MKYLPLKKKRDFQRVLKLGKRVYTGTLTVVVLPSEHTKMAVCVGKKFGKSVQRNKIKRLLREAFRVHVPLLKGTYTFLLIPRVRETYSFAAFSRDILCALQREKLC